MEHRSCPNDRREEIINSMKLLIWKLNTAAGWIGYAWMRLFLDITEESIFVSGIDCQIFSNEMGSVQEILRAIFNIMNHDSLHL